MNSLFRKSTASIAIMKRENYDTYKESSLKTNFCLESLMKVLLALVLTLSFLTPSLVWAQAAEGEHDIVANTQNDIMLIAGAGVGGAILGLSTLSFYDKPSKNLANVWTGAALGIIAGVVIVAISHANKSQDHLTTEYRPSSDFSTTERESWHVAQLETSTLSTVQIAAPVWGMSF
jgi:hypothetical protein